MKRLEVCVFLGRTLKSPVVRKTIATSRTKIAHLIHVAHRDEIEPPLTDWLREAYDVSERLSARRPGGRRAPLKLRRAAPKRKG
jgi:hypothetical protein